MHRLVELLDITFRYDIQWLNIVTSSGATYRALILDVVTDKKCVLCIFAHSISLVYIRFFC